MQDTSRRAPSSAYAWYVVAVLTIANLSANVDQFILNLLVGPIKRDLGIGDVQMSYLMGLAFALFYAALGFPIARLADRGNRRNIMAAGVALWSLFTAASAGARTFGRLFALRIGVGVGEATLTAPSVSLLADYFPPERLGRAMSVYSLGISLGAGAAYYIGGWMVGLLAVDGMWHVPLIGDIHPWQSVFLAVGLPGLLIALLFFTIREPRRSGPSSGEALPVSELVRYVGANRRTYLTHGLGFACMASTNFAIASWNPSLLIRTFGWTASEAGKAQGLLTMTIGTLGVLVGGWLGDRYVQRGRTDGPLRVGIIAAVGMLIAATAYPLMPTAALAVTGLAVVNFFAAFWWGAAPTAAAEMVPAALRAQSAALFFFALSLISRTLGPSSVAWLTNYVFRDDAALRYSLPIVNAVLMLMALGLFAAGLGSFRKTVASRDAWIRAA